MTRIYIAQDSTLSLYCHHLGSMSVREILRSMWGYFAKPDSLDTEDYRITVSMSIVCQKRDWQLRKVTGTNSLFPQFWCQALKRNSEGSVLIHGLVTGAALRCLTQRKVNHATNITTITISVWLLIQDPQHTVTRLTMPIKDDLVW